MNFDFYDIFSKIIPGGIMICVLIFCGWIPMPADNTDLLYLLISYFLGYIIDAIGFEIQERYLRKINAKRLLPQVFDKYKHKEEISIKYDAEKWEKDPIDKRYSKMFHATVGSDPRIKSFQNHWIGARNLALSFIFCLPILLLEIKEQNIESPKWIGILALFLIFQIILLNHAKNRQKLMFNQVLNSFYTLKINNSAPA
jgi:hypothetical protein